MEVKPRVITATISKVSMEAVQRALRHLPVVTICVDEAQVLWRPPDKYHSLCQVINTDTKLGWTGFLPYGYAVTMPYGNHLFSSPAGKTSGTGWRQLILVLSTAWLQPHSRMQLSLICKVSTPNIPLIETHYIVESSLITPNMHHKCNLYLDSLGIKRQNLKILFKESARPNIYLQVFNQDGSQFGRV